MIRNVAAERMIAQVRAGSAGPGEMIHVAPQSPICDVDRNRYFTWRRGGVVRAWADPIRTVWVFQLHDAWCSVQGVFCTTA